MLELQLAKLFERREMSESFLRDRGLLPIGRAVEPQRLQIDVRGESLEEGIREPALDPDAVEFDSDDGGGFGR